jgi:hypothetical protein
LAYMRERALAAHVIARLVEHPMLIGLLDKRIIRCYPLKYGYNLPNEPSKVSAHLPG